MNSVVPLPLILFLASCLFFGMGLIAACLAWVKGYRPWFWLISLGPIGALSMLLRPNLNRATTPEEREQWEGRADWTGGILSGIALFFMMMVAMPIAAIVVGFSYRSTAVTRATAVIAAPLPPQAADLVETPVAASEVSPAKSAPNENSNRADDPAAKVDLDRPRVPDNEAAKNEQPVP